MKKFLLAFLLICLLAAPTLAYSPRDSYQDDFVVITWLEDDNVFVAIANNGLARRNVTLDVEFRDSSWRPFYESRTVVVPGRSVLIESFLARRWPVEQVTVSYGERSPLRQVPVQKVDYMKSADYVVASNTQIRLEIDLSFLMEKRDLIRLTIDDYYSFTTGRSSRGVLHVSKVEGGLRFVPSRNSIEFERPSMVVSLKTPNTDEAGVLSFGMMQITQGLRSDVREYIEGPGILVYGRGMRFIDNTGIPTRTTR